VKAFFWAADEGGCAWYRCQLPAQALRDRGHEISVSMEMTDEQLADDTLPVVGQRVHNHGATTQWARWCFDQRRRTVFDADDDYFHMDPSNYLAYQEYARRTVRARLMGNSYTASVVTVATERLAELFRSVSSRVVVIPNGLPESLLSRPRPDNPKPVVGWVGSSSTLPELPIAWSAFSRVSEYGGVAQTVGIPYAHMRRSRLTVPGMRHTSWVQTERYLEAIEFDVWVAPYRHTVYNGAKFPTKALEAAFLGIPIICSDTDPYVQFVRHGVTGFIARTEADWHEYIRMLISDADMREEMGEAARQQAAEHTVEKYAHLWESVLFGRIKGFTL